MTTPVCAGTTRRGEPCTKSAKELGYCRQHVGQAAESVGYFRDDEKVPQAAAKAPKRPGVGVGPRRVRQARRRRPRARAEASSSFSRAPSLCHAQKAPRAIDMRAARVLLEYRNWRSSRAH